MECACERSLRAGVRPGMTLAHARALVPPAGLTVRPHQPERDLLALRALAERMLRFSPMVAPDPPDGLLMDITGCQRLFRGESRLLHAVADAAERIGFVARAAVAPTLGCAWAVARHGDGDRRRVRAGEIPRAIATLPTAGLRIALQTVAALAEVGIERIGHLFGLPRKELAQRFGGELLLRLDQAMGEAMELIEPVRPAPPPTVERVFDGPTTQIAAVESATRGLISDLCGALAQRERGATRLELTLARIHDRALCARLSLSRPCRDPRHLWALLRPRLERANLGWGVESISLTASCSAIIAHEQLEEWADPAGPAGSADDELALGRAVDVLTERLGAPRIVRAEPVETHIPERGFRRASLGTRAAVCAPLPHERPSVLLDRPEAVRVMALTPDGPVSRVWWRDRELAVLSSIGPERIAPEWWRCPAPTRDYFSIQDGSGRWLWVFRELETGGWFLHGLWA